MKQVPRSKRSKPQLTQRRQATENAAISNSTDRIKRQLQKTRSPQEAAAAAAGEPTKIQETETLISI